MSIKRGVKTTAVVVAMGMVISNTPVDVSKAAGKVTISRTATTLYVGDSETLALLNTTKKQDKKITWKSTETKVVTVSKKGIIKAKKAGTAQVKAKLEKKTYTCKVTVKKPKISYIEATPAPGDTGNQIYQKEVSQDMTTAAYWYGKRKDADEVLMDTAAILHQNELNRKSAPLMMELRTAELNYDGNAKKDALAKAVMSDARGTYKEAYRNNEKLDSAGLDAWFTEVAKNVSDAKTTSSDTLKYGVCVRRSELLAAPTLDLLRTVDTDNQLTTSAALVNEPLLVGMTTADGKFSFVYSQSLNFGAWMLTENLAICDSKEEWEKQCYLEGREDVMVVTDSHITLEESFLSPAVSAVDLHLGTQLPLVPDEAVDMTEEERYPWYNYSVYLPTRGADGKMVRKVALVSSHHHDSIHIGFPKMTIKNILTYAFNCLGDRYGWGGMLGAMDCSLYMRSIYRCFGLELARNTTGQISMPTAKTDMTGFTDEQKTETIAGAVPGSLLMFPGHITMYLGMDEGKAYVISDLGSVAESDGELNARHIYAVSVNTLNVRRRNGNTWLQSMTWLVEPFETEKTNS